MLSMIFYRNLPVDIPYLRIVIHDLLDDLLHRLLDKVIVVIHHGDLCFRYALDTFDLQMIQQKFLIISLG